MVVKSIVSTLTSQLKLDIIDCLDLNIASTMERIVTLLDVYSNHTFVKQVHLLDTIPGIGLC
jgi:hypothetical protein